MTWGAQGLKSPTTDAPWLSALKDYFRYHGVYAPMVRFMRDVDFRYKALILAGTFALPVSIVLSLQFQGQWEVRRQMSNQVHGWQYAVHIDHMQGVLVERGDRAIVEEQPKRLEEAYLALSHWRDQHGELAGQSDVWHELDKHYVAWQEGRSTPADQQARDDALLHALGEVQQAVVERTGLTLTRDPHVGHMISLGLERWQEAIDELGHSAQQGPGLFADGVSPAPTAIAMLGTQLDATLQRLRRSLAQSQGAAMAPCLPTAQQSTNWQELGGKVRQALADAQGSSWPAAQQAMQVARQEARQTRHQCLLALQGATAVQEAEQGDRLLLLGGIMALGLLLAAYTMVAFSRVMRGGMQLIQKEVERMAQGDLSGRALPLGDDEVAATLRSLRLSLLRLADLFAVVRKGVASVSHASGDISSASEALTSKILEATDAIDAMNAGIAITVDYLENNQQCVNLAVDCAREMSADAGRGRRAMTNLAEVIEGLQASSREIEKFVSMIDAIAFQTNLLALNASVEAAKAGTSGKGFAVVAAEVRGLANRVAEAAAQIGTVVSHSTNQIAQGQEIARTTVEAVRSTETHVNEMNRVLTRLSQITEGGRGNAEQMTATLKDVQHNSHQTRDLVVQVEHAAKELRQQSLKLAEQSSRFKLG
ncbi:MAG: hypothetical protein RI907_2528 [Pseudomonadota bacterium]